MSTVAACMNGDAPATVDEEAALLHAWRSRGDRAALDALVARLTPPLWSLALRLTGNAADAEDALQHGLMQVMQHAPGFTGRTSCRGWIMAVIANSARNQRRAAPRRRQRAEERGAAKERPLSHEPPPPAAENALLGMMDDLPEHERIPLSLHLIEGLDLVEVAAALGRSLNTVRSQVRRGISRLGHQSTCVGKDSPPPSCLERWRR